MKESYSPQYTLTNRLIRSLEKIAKMQGELETLSSNVENTVYLQTLANIDAVHFSTKLEGNTLTYEQVTQALDGRIKKIKSERDLKEILNYSRCRTFLFKRSQKESELNKKLVLETHKLLLSDIVGGKLKGHYREAQNVIRDAGTSALVYLPPDFREVDGLMNALFAWAIQQKVIQTSPLIIAAIFHYAFVTIHPFMDGNGRAARLLTNFLLYSSGYTVAQYAAIEKHHENNRKAYYVALRSLQANTFYDIPTDINLTSWIEYWLGCLEKTYQEALERGFHHKVTPEQTRLNARLQKAYSMFTKHRRLKASEYEAFVGLGRTQAVSDLNELINQGFIKKSKGGRSAVYEISDDSKRLDGRTITP